MNFPHLVVYFYNLLKHNIIFFFFLKTKVVHKSYDNNLLSKLHHLISRFIEMKLSPNICVNDTLFGYFYKCVTIKFMLF